jgi:hypothetical protein
MRPDLLMPGRNFRRVVELPGDQTGSIAFAIALLQSKMM